MSNILIIGSGAWGQKVKNSLQLNEVNVGIISAREFLILDPQSIYQRIKGIDLVWICSTPSLQLESLKKLQSFNELKIVIEKPICKDKFLNLEFFRAVSNQSNIFISRPWSFSQPWLQLKKYLSSEQEISGLNIRHSGEILRKYINPPQDWLHHDLCLLKDIKPSIELSGLEFRKNWSNENTRLVIKSSKDNNIEIDGGYSPDRISIFDLFLENGITLRMDMNQRTLLVQSANGMIDNYQYKEDFPINSMVKYFISIELSISNHKKELEILKTLQALATQ